MGDSTVADGCQLWWKINMCIQTQQILMCIIHTRNMYYSYR